MADVIILHIVHDFLFNFVYLKIVCIPTLACLLVNLYKHPMLTNHFLSIIKSMYLKRTYLQNRVTDFENTLMVTKRERWSGEGEIRSLGLYSLLYIQ